MLYDDQTHLSDGLFVCLRREFIEKKRDIIRTSSFLNSVLYLDFRPWLGVIRL